MLQQLCFRSPTIGVQLSHETAEVVVLEVLRKHFAGELKWLPNNEAASTPGVGVGESEVAWELLSKRCTLNSRESKIHVMSLQVANL